MLELIDVETFYGSVRALKGVSLKVNEGEIVALIGSNGAGKTTALMSISGIVPISSGYIYFKGKSVDKMTPDEVVMAGISLSPEGRRIFPKLTVLENLEMGAYLRRDQKEIKKDLSHAFELFPILYQRRYQYGGTLSGGEQQMLAIARALMSRPRLLLFDEPSLGLSPLMTNLIFQILKIINTDNHTTILLVEQNANMALQLSHRGYVMENGLIVLEGKSVELLNDENIKKAYLGI